MRIARRGRRHRAGELHRAQGGKHQRVVIQHRVVDGLAGAGLVVTEQRRHAVAQGLDRVPHAHRRQVHHGVAQHREFEVVEAGDTALVEQELARVELDETGLLAVPGGMAAQPADHKGQHRLGPAPGALVERPIGLQAHQCDGLGPLGQRQAACHEGRHRQTVHGRHLGDVVARHGAAFGIAGGQADVAGAGQRVHHDAGRVAAIAVDARHADALLGQHRHHVRLALQVGEDVDIAFAVTAQVQVQGFVATPHVDEPGRAPAHLAHHAVHPAAGELLDEGPQPGLTGGAVVG